MNSNKTEFGLTRMEADQFWTDLQQTKLGTFFWFRSDTDFGITRDEFLSETFARVNQTYFQAVQNLIPNHS